MQSTKQMSESIRLGALLAVSGGFMDAYSYIQRDQVFANAQTGNILLFGVNLSEGNFAGALHYFLPVLAFVLGIAAAELVRMHWKSTLHWRQVSVLVEAVILALVALFPLTLNLPANALISFACGIQVESFRKIRGNSIATTMCIGNMRSGTQAVCQYFRDRDREHLVRASLYYAIIVCFVLGAVLGNKAVGFWHEKAILCSSVLLTVAFIVMFVDGERDAKADI